MVCHGSAVAKLAVYHMNFSLKRSAVTPPHVNNFVGTVGMSSYLVILSVKEAPLPSTITFGEAYFVVFLCFSFLLFRRLILKKEKFIADLEVKMDMKHK